MLSCLPGELIDRVMDFLWDDQLALYSCALTCRAFYPASQYHLRGNILIESRWSSNRIIQALRSNLIPPDHLHSLQIHASGGGPPFVDGLLLSLSGHLGSLKRLEISYMEWSVSPMHPLVLTVALPSCASLISLKLGICEFLDLRQLQYFVGAFPQLQHLDIEEVSVASRISSLVTSALPRPELISLRVHCPMKYSADGSDCYGDLLSWLEYTPSIRSLRDVSLVLHSPGELVCSTILLRKLGRNLECLTLRLARQTRFCRSSSAFLTHYHTGDGQFSIEYCTGLRMLCFEEYAESSTSADDAAADLVVLLTQLPVPGRLRELRVLLNPLKVSRWECICAALPRKKFCSLELISVRYWWIKKAASSMQWEREVAEVLSSCCPGVRVRFQGLTWFAS